MFAPSHWFELQCAFDRCRFHEPWPLWYGLTHSVRIVARPSLGRDSVAHESIAAPDDLIFLLIRQQVLAGAQEEPHQWWTELTHPPDGVLAKDRRTCVLPARVMP